MSATAEACEQKGRGICGAAALRYQSLRQENNIEFQTAEHPFQAQASCSPVCFMHPAAEQEVMYLSDETTLDCMASSRRGKKPADQEIGGEEISLSQVKPEGEQERKPRRTTRQGGQRRAPAQKRRSRSRAARHRRRLRPAAGSRGRTSRPPRRRCSARPNRSRARRAAAAAVRPPSRPCGSISSAASMRSERTSRSMNAGTIW